MLCGLRITGRTAVWFGVPLFPVRGLQRLVEILDQVFGILDPYRDAHNVVARTRGLALLVGQLAVGGRGRVDDQRAVQSFFESVGPSLPGCLQQIGEWRT